MNEPIPIKKERTNSDRGMQWVLIGLFAVVVLALAIPLGVWLTRLALGG